MVNMVKQIIFNTIIIFILLSAVEWFYNWHYKRIETLEIENNAQARTINNLSVQVQTLIQDNKVTGFEEYYKGYKDGIS